MRRPWIDFRLETVPAESNPLFAADGWEDAPNSLRRHRKSESSCNYRPEVLNLWSRLIRGCIQPYLCNEKGRTTFETPRRQGMRSFAAVLLCLSLGALPAIANSGAKDTGKEDASAAASTAAAAASTAQPKEAAKLEPAAIESELQDLRSLVQSQMQELEAQR